MSVPVPVPLVGAVKLTELQVLLPSTVKVKPLPTIISSVASGIVPPGQGAFGVVELQLPLPAVVMVIENAFVTPATKNTISSE